MRRYSDAAGRRLETYLGKADDESTRAQVAALRHQIESANSVISQVRLLARAGFVTVLDGSAVAYHEGGRSIGPDTPLRLYFAARNHLLLASRTVPDPVRDAAPVLDAAE